MTQEELAVRHGISQSAVNRWESDGTKPGEQHWPLLADFLGVTIADIFALLNDAGPGPTTSVDLQRQIDALRRDVDMLLSERRNA